MSGTEYEELEQLNRDYIDAVQQSNVGRFQEILAEDFRCSNPDGSILDRQGFLEQVAKPLAITGLTAEDVEIRLFSGCAIIHATTTYRDPQGEPKRGRYTDVWLKQEGVWLAVSAHVTRA